MNLIFILVGASCTGKTNCINLTPVDSRFISCTTRPIREGEATGTDYYFLSQESFDMMLKRNLLFEHVTYGNYSYGLSEQEISKKVSLKDKDSYVILDAVGARVIKEKFPEDTKTIFFFASRETVEERLRKRGDTERDIEKRLEEYDNQCNFIYEADYIINSEQLPLKDVFMMFNWTVSGKTD